MAEQLGYSPMDVDRITSPATHSFAGKPSNAGRGVYSAVIQPNACSQRSRNYSTNGAVATMRR